MKQWKLAMLVLGACPLIFGAGTATTQPADGERTALRSGPTTRPDRMEEAGRRGGGRGNGQRQPRFDSGITQADWEGINSFMKAHSPNRLAFINQLPDGPRKSNMISIMVRVSRNLDHMDDAELSNIVIKRVGLEDQVFGLAVKLRGADSVAGDAIKQNLETKITELVDTNIKEREIRIDRLKKLLDAQEQNLEHDDSQRSTLIAQRLKMTIDEAQRPNGPLQSENSEPVLASPEANTEVTPGKK